MSAARLPDGGVVGCAVAAAVGARWAHPVPLVALVLALVVATARPRPELLIVAVALLASALAFRSLSGMAPRAAGRWSGSIHVLSDPEWRLGQVQADVRVDGKHLLATARGQPAAALASRSAGDVLQVRGSIARVAPPVPGWMLARHVAGRLSITDARNGRNGPALFRFANAVRRSLLRSALVLPAPRRALFAGFILGDSRGESPETNDDFRAAGLTHLLVVSGQNVSFTLAAFEPLLARVRRRGRLIGALMILVVFATMTRFEPSVLRASVMAALVLLAGHLGRPQTPLRILALAVTVLLLVDPMLAHSVGFGLSVGACLGIALLDGPLRRALPGPLWVRAPLATTIAAQIGTMIVLVPVFGGVPLASVPANILALPAAEPVMGWGIVAGLPAGLLGRWASTVVHLPTGLLLWWVAGVAHVVGSLPLGQITTRSALALGAVVILGLRYGSRRHVRRGLAVALAAIVASVVGSGLSVAQAVDVGISRGTRLWRPAGWAIEHRADLIVIEHGADAEHVLKALRLRGVDAIDLVIVRNGGRPQAQLLNTIARRVRVGGVLAGDRVFAGAVRPVIVAEAGLVVRAGATRITVDDVSGGQLHITVTEAAARGSPVHRHALDTTRSTPRARQRPSGADHEQFGERQTMALQESTWWIREQFSDCDWTCSVSARLRPNPIRDHRKPVDKRSVG